MINKIYIVIISILIFSISNVSGYQTALNILYVDDNNIDGPWDGTWEHPYQFIQDAVDNANIGYEIFVNNGVYYENSIIIDKPLVLNGEDVGYCIVDGNRSGSVFLIHSSDVCINGFTIRNSGTDELRQDSGILAYSMNLVDDKICNIQIFNNKIIDCYNGMYTYFIDDSEIFENYVYNSTELGITLQHGCRNMIYRNFVQKSGYMGISLWGVGPGGYLIWPRWKASKNIVTENICIENREGIALGEGCIDNEITMNTFENNSWYGVVIGYSMNNKVTKNNIVNNEIDGFIYARLFRQAFTNTWDENYWGDSFDDPIKIDVLFSLPYIFNSDKTFLLSVYDTHPAEERYD